MDHLWIWVLADLQDLSWLFFWVSHHENSGFYSAPTLPLRALCASLCCRRCGLWLNSQSLWGHQFDQRALIIWGTFAFSGSLQTWIAQMSVTLWTWSKAAECRCVTEPAGETRGLFYTGWKAHYKSITCSFPSHRSCDSTAGTKCNP